jgi:hypothetical protein
LIALRERWASLKNGRAERQNALNVTLVLDREPFARGGHCHRARRLHA